METARLLRQWVHRQGVDSLDQFVRFTVPLREGPEGCGWLEQQLNHAPLPTVSAAAPAPPAMAEPQAMATQQSAPAVSIPELELDGLVGTDVRVLTDASERSEAGEMMESAEAMETAAAASPSSTSAGNLDAPVLGASGATPTIEAIDPWIPRNPSSSSNPFDLPVSETAGFEGSSLAAEPMAVDSAPTDDAHPASPSVAWSPARFARGWPSLSRVRSRLREWVDDTIEGLREPVSEELVDDLGAPHELKPQGDPPEFDLQPLASATLQPQASAALQDQVSSSESLQEFLPTKESRSSRLPIETKGPAKGPAEAPAPAQPAPPPHALNDLRSWLPDEDGDKNLPEAC
jgi:hypothetical protein